MNKAIETPIKTSIEIQIPFYDVDIMQVVWHGYYAKYMEVARCQLLDLIDYNYLQMSNSGFLWPIVDMRIKYIKPLRFQQKIIVTAQFAEIDYGLKVDFVFTDLATGEKLTSAFTKQVAVDKVSEEMCLISPPVLNEKIETYLRSLVN